MSLIVLGAGNTTQNSLKSQDVNHFQNILKHLQWVIDFFFKVTPENTFREDLSRKPKLNNYIQ